MLKIKRSRDRRFFNMRIPIPGKDGLYIETGHCSFSWGIGEGERCINRQIEKRKLIIDGNHLGGPAWPGLLRPLPNMTHEGKGAINVAHYTDVIISAMTFQTTSVSIVCSTLFRRRSKKASKLRATGLCKGNPSVTSGFPLQRAGNRGNGSIWWHHHGKGSFE